MAGKSLGFLLVGGLVLGWPAEARAQAPAGPPRAWQVEALGGVRRVAADDLNAQVESDMARVDYLRTAQVEQQHEGGLVGLSRGYPFAVRVVRRLGPHWSVGGGFSFAAAERRSSVGSSYAFTSIDPRAQEYVREFSQTLRVDPLVLTVRDYLPYGLVRYDRPLATRLRIGAALQAGWLIAEAELERTFTTEGGYYPYSRRTEETMTGRGGGPAVDALVSAHLALTSRLGLVVEGGYIWHEAGNVTGAQVTTVRIQDGEAADVELEETSRTNGRWVNQPVTVQTSDGPWQGTSPAIGPESAPFTLSVSGWQVSVGVSIGF